MLVLAVFVVACASRTDQLLSSLPTTVQGHSFGTVTIVTDSYLSGHAIDDVLAALGKRRPDASAVFRSATNMSGTIGAVAVSGVDDQRLTSAVVNNWRAAAVTSRSQTTVGGKVVWLVQLRPAELVAVWSEPGVAYIAESDDQGLLDAMVRAMP